MLETLTARTSANQGLAGGTQTHAEERKRYDGHDVYHPSKKAHGCLARYRNIPRMSIAEGLLVANAAAFEAVAFPIRMYGESQTAWNCPREIVVTHIEFRLFKIILKWVSVGAHELHDTHRSSASKRANDDSRPVSNKKT